MSSVEYWKSLNQQEKLRFVSKLALEAKKLNDFVTPLTVMKVNMNNGSEFITLFTKAIKIVNGN